MDEIDHDAFRKLTEYLVENGVDALMVNGTSGEFLLQSDDERKAAIRTVVKAANGRVPVIAGISEASTKSAIDLGQDADDSGADAVISTGPIYYKTSEEGLFGHYSSILEGGKSSANDIQHSSVGWFQCSPLTCKEVWKTEILVESTALNLPQMIWGCSWITCEF